MGRHSLTIGLASVILLSAQQNPAPVALGRGPRPTPPALVLLPGSPADRKPDDYTFGPDSMVHAGVPVGTWDKFTLERSDVFPGTQRFVWTYVPAQYDPKKPTALMVFQDGVRQYAEREDNPTAGRKAEYRVPVVLDNLIARGELPVMIAVFIDPGSDDIKGRNGNPNFSNRSVEYDTLSDQYSQFLAKEILPPIEKKYNIRKDPAGRGIGGISSGAICAFTVAWNHPDWFGKVLSDVGSFTNIRGGHVYPQLVSEAARKPIRIHMQDGINDNRRPDSPERDWYLQNKLMHEALLAKHYDVKYVLGDGIHSSKHGGAILPDSLRWLWADQTRITAKSELPVEWIDPETGHRVIRLSKEDGTESLYFHQNAYSADGKKLVVTNPHGIATINLATREIDQAVEGRVSILVTGHKTGQVYYTKDAAIFATNLDTHATREVAKLPPQGARGQIAVNADETMIVGVAADPDGKTVPRTPPAGGGGGSLEANWARGAPRMLYTIDIKSGKFSKIYTENDWTNHLQMSPTDPNLIMFCHEGPWHYNDRVWTIRTDGSGLKLMHERTMNMEIAGHEFFSGDGKTVWYDLQTPKSTVFWLAGVDLATGHRTLYNLQRNEWSVHYNVSADGSLFAGDGGGPSSVAAHSPDGKVLNPPGNGQWIYLFRPAMVRGSSFRDKKDLTDIGYFKSERLVSLANHNYSLEPNVTFSPDMKWVVFRSNMLGPTHVFAVEIEKAAK